MDIMKKQIIRDDELIKKIKENPFIQCSECKGLKYCSLLPVGYCNGIKCRYNKIGYCNDKKILEDKYKRFDCNKLDEIKALINKYHNMYMWGKQGFGKTHWLYWLARQYYEQGRKIFISKWSEINQMLKEEPRSEYLDRKPLRVRLKKIEILCIDDLGNERMTKENAEVLSTILDYRYLHNKPTFITSNYSPQKLGLHYTETKEYGQPLMEFELAKQIVSRIDDVNNYATFELNEKNWRK